MEGFQDREALVLVADETPRPVGVEGGCVSVGGGGVGVEQALVEVVSVARDERLPAASRASTAKV